MPIDRGLKEMMEETRAEMADVGCEGVKFRLINKGGR